jgi:signal peptidase I
VSYWFDPPSRGDIIVCYFEHEKLSVVKRIIGLPGDTVSVAYGKVYVNGMLLDESAYWDGEIFSDMPPQVIPEDAIFVMGDNRNVSEDSRSENVGPVALKHIVGRVRYVIWPFSNLRPI